MHAGASIEEATVVALDTAGQAVAFAGTTVVISLLGMVLMGLAFVTGLAAAAATVVAVTAVASLTLLPALLGFAGQRIELTRWRDSSPLCWSRCLVGVASRSSRWLSSGFARRRRASGRASHFGEILAESRDRCARRSPTDGAASSSTARGSRRSAGQRSSSCLRSRSSVSACLLR